MSVAFMAGEPVRQPTLNERIEALQPGEHIVFHEYRATSSAGRSSGLQRASVVRMAAGDYCIRWPGGDIERVTLDEAKSEIERYLRGIRR